MYAAQYHFDDIITNNQKMLNLKHLGQTIARSDASVLIQGESGTGKELFAQAIHNASLVSHQLVSLNCSSIPKELLEANCSAMRAALSPVPARRQDRQIRTGRRGYALLDELGTMPMDMQVKLLRVWNPRNTFPWAATRRFPSRPVSLPPPMRISPTPCKTAVPFRSLLTV